MFQKLKKKLTNPIGEERENPATPSDFPHRRICATHGGTTPGVVDADNSFCSRRAGNPDLRLPCAGIHESTISPASTNPQPPTTPTPLALSNSWTEKKVVRLTVGDQRNTAGNAIDAARESRWWPRGNDDGGRRGIAMEAPRELTLNGGDTIQTESDPLHELTSVNHTASSDLRRQC
ncbi:hypothetical protein TIFTF001_025683 [Ficus carica]|uniref:Uncharacterized protein n=1 Tax=Ficus carica TaxID=3494 RepID=A0AA88AX38_FICCA|nr:hypothetical protein TIFTF001_025683 [Ficus carica]